MKLFAKTCKACGKPFSTRKSKTIYCGRACQHQDTSGPNHHCWKGGKILKSGYWWVWISPEDPYFSMAKSVSKDTYRVYEHRLVMARKLERPLLSSETVHHLDHDRLNNHPDNLVLFSDNAAHKAFEWEEMQQKGVLCAATIRKKNLLTPFSERVVVGGMSAGLSISGYDLTVAESLCLKPDDFVLASSIERFKMPNNILGTLFNKSTWARRGLYVFSTVIEPSWEGFLTLELKNMGGEIITIAKGMPIAQVLFHFTDAPTQGYGDKKYQNQGPGPQKARYE